jgi:signal transduction histidine kinase
LWWLRASSLVVAAIAFVSGGVLVLGLFPEGGELWGSVIYAFSSAGAGILIAMAALLMKGRARRAWLLIGIGVLCWGIGETVWTTQSLTTGEIPYPGLADVFYVLGYPLIFLGVLVLPYLRPGRYERLRLSIDAAAGAVSLVVVMWVAYLNQVVSVGGGQSAAETALGLFYPFGDVFLAIALMILAMRRSEQRLDLRVLFLAVGVALTTGADVAFSLQVAAETYVEWAWLDGIWLISYAAFALVAYAQTRPVETTQTSYRAVGGWRIFAPYAAVAALFAAQLLTSSGEELLLNLATTLVAALVIMRQSIAIRERRELLERQRDDLVASVSHELRTPLTSIQGFAQLLGESWGSFSDTERRQMVGDISDEAAHLGRIVTDLIDVARDRLQTVKLNRRLMTVSDLVSEAMETAGGDRPVDLRMGDEATVDVDPDRLRQVLVNLITNAQRYGRSRVEVVTETGDGFVSIAVHDDGDGVPAKYQEAIFDRFERGAQRFNTTVPGSGIGLSVARDLLAAHGTSITYRDSERLGGACFQFVLPLAQPAMLASARS